MSVQEPPDEFAYLSSFHLPSSFAHLHEVDVVGLVEDGLHRAEQLLGLLAPAVELQALAGVLLAELGLGLVQHLQALGQVLLQELLHLLVLHTHLLLQLLHLVLGEAETMTMCSCGLVCVSHSHTHTQVKC